jgi:FtsH-binding integral membrane protein
MQPELIIALAITFGIATVLFVILNQQNSPRLARVHSWPTAVRTVLALILCAAVGFTISIPLGLLGVTGIWAVVVGLPLVLAYLFWRDVRAWWRSRGPHGG